VGWLGEGCFSTCVEAVDTAKPGEVQESRLKAAKNVIEC